MVNEVGNGSRRPPFEGSWRCEVICQVRKCHLGDNLQMVEMRMNQSAISTCAMKRRWSYFGLESVFDVQ